MEDNYEPVACHFYDELESASTKKLLNKIVYTRFDGAEKTVDDFIVDFETKDKEEFVVLKEKGRIRLDKILRFNGLNPKSFK